MARQTKAVNYSRSEKEKAEARIAELISKVKSEAHNDDNPTTSGTMGRDA